jgi:hypothetical protein
VWKPGTTGSERIQERKALLPEMEKPQVESLTTAIWFWDQTQQGKIAMV